MIARGFIGPRAMLERKPGHGKPCNHCGLCCVAVVCPFGQAALKRGPEGPCPALTKRAEGEYVCGLVVRPEDFAPEIVAEPRKEAAGRAAAVLIGVGEGCDARFNGEPTDHSFYDKLAALDKENARHVRLARKLWNVKAIS